MPAATKASDLPLSANLQAVASGEVLIRSWQHTQSTAGGRSAPHRHAQAPPEVWKRRSCRPGRQRTAGVWLGAGHRALAGRARLPAPAAGPPRLTPTPKASWSRPAICATPRSAPRWDPIAIAGTGSAIEERFHAVKNETGGPRSGPAL